MNIHMDKYKTSMKTNSHDGSYVTITTDAESRQWESPRLESAADRNPQELDSGTTFGNKVLLECQPFK